MGVAVGSLATGFVAGLCLFKVKSRWCPRCGRLTTDAIRGNEGVNDG